MPIARTCLAVALASSLSSLAHAQCPWSATDRVEAPGGPALELFGYPVALSGDEAAVGAPADPGSPGGSVYLLRRAAAGWSVVEKLAPSAPAAGSGFGAALALQGGRLVVGAPYENAQGFHTGAAYVFERSGTGWVQRAHLVASNAFRRDYFGAAVALDGSTALIGAYGATVASVHYNGAAYFYEEQGGAWTESQRVLPAPGGERGLFGRAVALAGDVAAIGAPFEDPPLEDAGAAYVFERSAGAWSLVSKLLSVSPESGAAFGAAVAIAEQRVFVGAPRYDDAKEHFGLGAVEVFRDLGGTWGLEAELRPADNALGDYFGFALAARGARLVVGAHGNAEHGFESGAAYVFELAGGAWHEREELHAIDAAAGARFGLSIALGMDALLVGAPRALGASSAPGVAYAFEPQGSLEEYGPSCAGALGVAPALLVSGCPSEGASLVLRVAGGPPGAPVEVRVGRERASLALPGGCLQLVAPVMHTIALPPLDAQGSSMGSLSLPLATAPGVTFTLQAFVGDPALVSALATSPAVEVVVP